MRGRGHRLPRAFACLVIMLLTRFVSTTECRSPMTLRTWAVSDGSPAGMQLEKIRLTQHIGGESPPHEFCQVLGIVPGKLLHGHGSHLRDVTG